MIEQPQREIIFKSFHSPPLVAYRLLAAAAAPPDGTISPVTGRRKRDETKETMKKLQNANVLPSLVDLKGKKVADIGCGDGSLVRLMTRHGANVIGVECNPKMLERARGAKPAGDENYSEGIAQELPFDDGKLDLVVFFNSLHHVPVEDQAKALAEARRALKAGGHVYVSEPLAEGAHFELMQPVHDETEVRAAAYRRIKEAEHNGFVEELETTYVHDALYADFTAFKARMLAINPGKAKAFAKLEKSLAEAFERLGRKTDGGFAFEQPMRVDLLKKTK